MPTYKRGDFDFELSPDRIAQHPSARRDASRLMVCRGQEPPVHTTFSKIGSYFQAGDVLVLNRTKVMNSRCFAHKENGTRIEVFVLGLQVDPTRVPVMLRPGKRIQPGTQLHFPNSGVSARVIAKLPDETTMDFGNTAALLAVLEADGSLPLPPYIKRESGPRPEDQDRYQTIFATDLGAVAAPTAGLHFTQTLLDGLRQRGVETVFITHHVGIGTFKPISTEDVRDHRMAAEHYQIDEESAASLNRAHKEGRRIIAVGTTSTRCLESNFNGGFHPGSLSTDLYIYPGYKFKAINALVTNFHLPGSTLILLVSALVGRRRIMELYRAAIAADYRFYSYGDAMLLIP